MTTNTGENLSPQQMGTGLMYRNRAYNWRLLESLRYKAQEAIADTTSTERERLLAHAVLDLTTQLHMNERVILTSLANPHLNTLQEELTEEWAYGQLLSSAHPPGSAATPPPPADDGGAGERAAQHSASDEASQACSTVD